MQLSRVDLNLFTIFDAIYREGGITAASKRLHLSQPAVSHALARLRELLDDPLFERRGRAMVPTPLARSLAATVATSLGNIEQCLQRTGHFDPATSERRFTIAVREAQEPRFLPALVAHLDSKTRSIGVATVRIERRDLEEDLQSGEIDAALDVALPVSREVRRAPVSSEPLAVLARKNHPAVRKRLDIATYLDQEHVLVTGRRHGGGHEDVALGQLGMSRRIRVRCQDHSAAAEIVARSGLLVTLPSSQAELANRDRNNQLLAFPAEIAPLELFLYWHANVDADPGSKWFRELVLGLLRR